MGVRPALLRMTQTCSRRRARKMSRWDRPAAAPLVRGGAVAAVALPRRSTGLPGASTSPPYRSAPRAIVRAVGGVASAYRRYGACRVGGDPVPVDVRGFGPGVSARARRAALVRYRARRSRPPLPRLAGRRHRDPRPGRRRRFPPRLGATGVDDPAGTRTPGNPTPTRGAITGRDRDLVGPKRGTATPPMRSVTPSGATSPPARTARYARGQSRHDPKAICARCRPPAR